MNKFTFLKALDSPFKPFKLKWYCGRRLIGTPYFFPRRLVKDPSNPGRRKFVPKKIGFDFVSLGWKTKWSDTDYRFEWSPRWSFVFFNWQIAVMFNASDHYWEAWLYYYYNTDKTKSKAERVKQCRKDNPMMYTVYRKDPKTGDNTGRETIDCYDLILREKYLK